MKRLITVSLLLGVLAGNVFAQLTLSGEAYVGFQLEKPFNDTDETLGAYHRKKGAPLFNFMATAARENYGVKLDTNFQTTNPLSINGIYGWVNFLDKSLNLTIGKISDGKWVSSLDADHEITFDEITGFRLEYKTPLPGLNVGAAFTADDYTFEKFGKKTVLAASYVNPMLNTVIAYDLGNNARLLWGLNYTGIDELTSAGIQLKAINLASWESPVYPGEILITEKVGYRVMRPLVVSLLLSQTMYGIDKDTVLLFNPSVSYRLFDNLTASFGLKVESPDYFETQVISIKPCVEYRLKGAALFYTEYEMTLAKYKGGSLHRFGFGIDVKAF